MVRSLCGYGVIWGTRTSPGSLAVGLSPEGEIQLLAAGKVGDVIEVCLSDADLHSLRRLLTRAARDRRVYVVRQRFALETGIEEAR